MWSNAKKFHLHIELTSKCNSACPNCPRFITGTKKLNPTINLQELKLKDIKKWFDITFIQKIGSINFCGNLGDPSNCTEMVQIVRYFHESNKDIKIKIHTNGGARNKDFWGELGTLSKQSNENIIVVFSVDGLEDTNHIYRRNVEWGKLIENITTYTKNGGNGIWEFLLFKHNEHQTYLAKYRCKVYGLKEIHFKRAVGFENHVIKKTTPMGAYDKNGSLEYIIEPSTDFSNSIYEYEKIELPKKIDVNFTEFENNSLLYSDYKSFENNEINCKAVKRNGDIEIFLNYKGEIRPCCFIGVDLDKVTLGGYVKQLKDIFNYDCNLNSNSLENILNYFDDEIENKWSNTHENGKCVKCTLTCGMSSQVDIKRLYENIEI